MRKHRNALLLMCALMGGCADHLEWNVDERFTAEECELIEHARTDWQVAVGEDLHLTFGAHVDGDLWKSRNEIIRGHAVDSMVREEQRSETLGYTLKTTIGSHVVIIVDDVHNEAVKFEEPYERTFLYTIRHELGHALNTTHTRIPGSVMYWKDTGYSPDGIDSYSVDNWCEHNDGCVREQLRGMAVPQPPPSRIVPYSGKQ